MKLYYPDSRVLARQTFFSVRVVQVWNNVPNEIVSATCVSVFKSLLNSGLLAILAKSIAIPITILLAILISSQFFREKFVALYCNLVLHSNTPLAYKKVSK